MHGIRSVADEERSIRFRLGRGSTGLIACTGDNDHDFSLNDFISKIGEQLLERAAFVFLRATCSIHGINLPAGLFPKCWTNSSNARTSLYIGSHRRPGFALLIAIVPAVLTSFF